MKISPVEAGLLQSDRQTWRS